MNENRYSRQELCFNEGSTQKLKNSSVLIVGVGGLGCAVATHLTLLGIGRIYLCEFDTVSITNLNRQFLYTPENIGQSKVKIAQKKLKELNPDTQIEIFPYKFSAQSQSTFPKVDLIMDCLDSFSSRIELVHYAKKTLTPLIHSAINGFQGQVNTYIPSKSACPFCALDIEDDEKETAEKNEKEVVPSMISGVNLFASFQSTQAVKYLLNSGDLLLNTFLCYDLLTLHQEILEIEVNTSCIACSK